MKKLFSCFLVLTMLLALFSGCSGKAPETAEAPAAVLTTAPSAAAEPAADTKAQTQAPTTIKTVSVRTIDELLTALASDTEIVLEAGTYDLTAASDYGLESKNPAYTWESGYDGFQLELHDLHNLVLHGLGKDSVNLTTVPRYSNVLVLNNCSDVVLEGFTVGHTEGGEMCSGGVVMLLDSKNISLNGMGLYGCGTIGVDMWNSENVTVHDCDIYDCSYSGIRAQDSRAVMIHNTRIHDLKDSQFDPCCGIQLDYCEDVTVTDCSVTGNTMAALLDFTDSGKVTVTGCQFSDNRLTEAGFRFYSCEPAFIDNRFENNTLRSWYAGQSQNAVDGNGTPMTAESFPALAASEAAAPAADRNPVHVSTVDEFLAAIGNDTEIILDEALYDLSLAADYGKGSKEFYSWNEEYDGPELVISNVTNFGISSADGDLKAHTISSTPRYADVLSFQHCQNVSLSGFTAGHTKEPGSCSGGVLHFEDSDNVTVENCGLFGCGIIGIHAQNCSNIHAVGCDIYECSQGGISMWNVQDVQVDSCTFRDLGDEYGPGYEMRYQDCQNVLVDGKPYGE